MKLSSRNLPGIEITEKNNFLREFSRLSSKFPSFDYKVGRISRPNFTTRKGQKNFLKYLIDAVEYRPENFRFEFPEIGRKCYEYKKSTVGSSVKSIPATEPDWSFPDTCCKSIGSTVRGLIFFLPKLIWFTKKFNPAVIKFDKY